MAFLKCPMYVPRTAAKLIEARGGVLRLMQEVPLTEEEKLVAEGDVQALSRYIQKRKDVPPPAVPDSRYVFSGLTGDPDAAGQLTRRSGEKDTD